jgi:plasmid stability protein
MAQVIVRNLSETTLQLWKKRAEQRGHSLEQELRIALERDAPPSFREELIDRLAAIRATTPKGVAQTPSELLIREDRDNDEPHR